ncbi:hypothetical protein J7T55_000729 [Diaporthe amygdali]|uniref:uncharacterized protein n=1 Tax=Phomopsis amygdali TaxID=1214568 RepID=UPI0022FDDB7B|nr:uncharacterized protein J7T55_000729 [Diaporthe amygdali]KAJ0110296.1 hypothetical protein J7T55_000729 [Diaporthe amygdali]
MDASKCRQNLDKMEKHDVENSPQLDILAIPALSEPDRQDEKQVVHKLDWRMAPLFAALYFIAYLDRSNIGNAAVAGMTTSLGLTGPQYSTAVSVFFATYVPLEIPIVLAMQKVGPHRAIALMCFGWSVVTIGTAFVKNFGDLVAVRVLLGVTEAGFFPCLSLYISMVYKKEEQGRRIAYLFSSVALAGMFGGLIATGITYMGSRHGVESWSWLYIIEGCISILVASWVFFGLPANPTEAKFLTAKDKNVIAIREAQRSQYMGSLVFEWSEVGKALLDPKVWLTAFIQFFQDIILYGFSTFLPSILRLDLGYSTLQAQYLSVPVYLLGGISFFTAAVLGDKWKLRGTILFTLDIFAVIGYAILLAVPAIGLQQTIGNAAGIVAPQVYRAAPYRLGHWCSLASVLISMGLIATQIGYLHILNRKKSQIGHGERSDDRKETTGEGDLAFKYVY